MFGSYTNEFKCNLRDKLDIREIIDIFTSEDMPLESRIQFRTNFTSGVFSSKTLVSNEWDYQPCKGAAFNKRWLKMIYTFSERRSGNCRLLMYITKTVAKSLFRPSPSIAYTSQLVQSVPILELWPFQLQRQTVSKQFLSLPCFAMFVTEVSLILFSNFSTILSGLDIMDSMFAQQC